MSIRNSYWSNVGDMVKCWSNISVKLIEKLLYRAATYVRTERHCSPEILFMEGTRPPVLPILRLEPAGMGLGVGSTCLPCRPGRPVGWPQTNSRWMDLRSPSTLHPHGSRLKQERISTNSQQLKRGNTTWSRVEGQRMVGRWRLYAKIHLWGRSIGRSVFRLVGRSVGRSVGRLVVRLVVPSVGRLVVPSVD